MWYSCASTTTVQLISPTTSCSQHCQPEYSCQLAAPTEKCAHLADSLAGLTMRLLSSTTFLLGALKEGAPARGYQPPVAIARVLRVGKVCGGLVANTAAVYLCRASEKIKGTRLVHPPTLCVEGGTLSGCQAAAVSAGHNLNCVRPTANPARSRW